MEINRACYKFEKLQFKDGLFNKSIDATYIIHLKNNGRYERILRQLEQNHPTNTIYILFNEGYKNCKKELPNYLPQYDLSDAFLQIFKHSIENDYNGNILILEDDYDFSEKIKDPAIINDIDDFLISKSNERFVYYFGCIPHIQIIGSTNHNRLFLSGGTHSVIYSRPFREYILNNYDQYDFGDWDIFINFLSFRCNRYLFKEPLCYQLFPVTENSKNWYNPFGIQYFVKACIKYFLLDTQYEPGYSFFYTLSKFMIFILFFLLLIIFYLLWIVIRYIFQFRVKNRKNR